MTCLYNEIDPFAAAWTRNLVDAGHIAPGRVDERSIRELAADDVAGVRQCHFFSGIGVWSYALRLAEWPDDREVWTGSCPCQPFSGAGKRRGDHDDRHLWPAWFSLIRKRRPPVIFGEQVASTDALDWLDAVQSDLEGEGYAVGAADLCAAGVGAPHIRQRLYFMAYADGLSGRLRVQQGQPRREVTEARGRCEAGELGDAGSTRGRRNARAVPRAQAEGASERFEHRRIADVALHAGETRDVADTSSRPSDGGLRGRQDEENAIGEPSRPPGQRDAPRGADGALADTASAGRPSRVDEREEQGDRPRLTDGGGTFWDDCDWIPCSDGKWRPVEPGTFPLAHGATARVGRLRAYGNAINAEQAAVFIRAAKAVIDAV